MTSEEDHDVDFALIGTPLEPYEEDTIPSKKPRNIEDEIVTDEKGRRRFHGAFTGGFSAGYFNTVGTEEGWTPTAFKSSRLERSTGLQQKPEQYMDDEDLGEYGIAPRQVKTTKNFRDEKSASRKGKHSYIDQDSIFGAPLRQLIHCSSESIGVRLLRKLGWRPGQGVGPRVKTKKKKQKLETAEPTESSAKLYGCARPPIDTSDESDIDLPEGTTFAPDDIDTIKYTSKTNTQGLGYVGLSRSVLSQDVNRQPAFLNKGVSAVLRGSVGGSKKKLAIRGQAFGVGAYEEDDDDIYAADDMSNYDFSALNPDKGALGKIEQKAELHRAIGYVSNKLDEFHLSSNPVAPKKRFYPPDLPRGFRPFHSKFSNSSDGTAPSDKSNLDRHSMTWGQRGNLLGETSATDASLLSSSEKTSLRKARDYAARVTKECEMIAEFLKQDKGDPMQVKPKSQPNFLPITVPVTAPAPAVRPIPFRNLPDVPSAAALSGFKPFASDVLKQRRYEQFLSLVKHGKTEMLGALQPGEMTEWEKEREKHEFQKAAQLYNKPVNSVMASRFTSAQNTDEENAGQDNPSDLLCKAKPISAEAKAAESKMFGKLTREVIEWHPDKILCKRFNVPNPYPNSNLVGVLKIKKDKSSLFDFMFTEVETHEENEEVVEAPLKLALAAPQTSTNGDLQDGAPKSKPSIFDAIPFINQPKPSSKPATIVNTVENSTSVGPEPFRVEPESVPMEMDEAPQRPSIDLFKAIFCDTDSENEESDAEKDGADIQNGADQNTDAVPESLAVVSGSLKERGSMLTAEPRDDRTVSKPWSDLSVLKSTNEISVSKSTSVVSVSINETLVSKSSGEISVSKTSEISDTKTTSALSVSKSASEVSVSKAARGLFANIDFDKLNQRQTGSSSVVQSDSKHCDRSQPGRVLSDDSRLKSVESSDGCYGPELPPAFNGSYSSKGSESYAKHDSSSKSSHSKRKRRRTEKRKKRRKVKKREDSSDRSSWSERDDDSSESNPDISNKEKLDKLLMKKLKELTKKSK